MIYIHPTDKIHTPDGQGVFNFSQHLQGFNAVFRKSLLVIYYYYKERKYI